MKCNRDFDFTRTGSDVSLLLSVGGPVTANDRGQETATAVRSVIEYRECPRHEPSRPNRVAKLRGNRCLHGTQARNLAGSSVHNSADVQLRSVRAPSAWVEARSVASLRLVCEQSNPMRPALRQKVRGR
jgi:hypothetical protein